jgi:hypothetical protein
MARLSPSWRLAFSRQEVAQVLGPGGQGILRTPDGRQLRVKVREDGHTVVAFAPRRRAWARYLDWPREWQMTGVLVRPAPSFAERRLAELLGAARAIARHCPEDVWPELRADAASLLAAAHVLQGDARTAGWPQVLDGTRSLARECLPPDARVTTLRREGAPARVIEEVAHHFASRTPFSVAWQSKYDCEATGQRGGDGAYRGYLFTFYRGTGNGHFYALLDGYRAIYMESD